MVLGLGNIRAKHAKQLCSLPNHKHMRKFILSLITALTGFIATAQSVGIGTSSPNAKALLDISSISKGVLLPRMTTIERINNITSPPDGLLVYDTDKNEFYHYTGTAWRAILNSGYWSRPSASRNRISNVSDSVGIGLTSPTEWLDVDGNIRSRNNIQADNNIMATGFVNGSGLISTGNLTVTGTSVLNGTVSTTGDMVINSSTATFQLKSAGVNTGFFQLSGENVRMGTNSGNSDGDLIIRMNGSDRVTVNAAGDIDLDGKLTRSSVTGANSLLPVCFGLIDDAGTILSGSGNFTVSHTADGVYRITCNQMTSLCIGLATPLYTGFYTSALQFTVNSIDVRIHRPGPILTDGAFSFLIYRAY
jgi:hypothetical protein